MQAHNTVKKDDTIFISKDVNIISRHDELCSLFNNYYVDIVCETGTKDQIDDNDTCESCLSSHDEHPRVIQIIRNYMHRHHAINAEFNFNNFNVYVVKHHLMCLQTNKATGCDKLPSRPLKTGSDSLVTRHVTC